MRLKKIYWNWRISFVFKSKHTYVHKYANSYLNNLHAIRRKIIKIMFLIKFQEYFEKMYSCSGTFSNSPNYEKKLFRKTCNVVRFNLA